MNDADEPPDDPIARQQWVADRWLASGAITEAIHRELSAGNMQQREFQIERDWGLLCRAPEMNRLVLMPGGDETLLIVSLRRLPLPSVRRFQGPMWSCVRSALEFLDEHRAVCKGAAAVGEGGQSRSTPDAQDAGTSRLSAPSPDRGYL